MIPSEVKAPPVSVALVVDNTHVVLDRVSVAGLLAALLGNSNVSKP